MKEKLAFQHVAVLAHPKVNEALEEAGRIAGFLEHLGVKASSGQLYDAELRLRVQASEFDLVIVLGGDGTMLRAGHLCGPVQVPILGINMGHFGFLIEIRQEQWREFIPLMLNGKFWLERRMMLKAEHWRGEDCLEIWDVMNEVVVSRGLHVRPVRLAAYVDGRFLTAYVADGLIAATPTGSTAYALAAGGPILPPELRNILLVAVAPHLSVDRAIVLAEGATVSITVHADHQPVMSIDGQPSVMMQDEDHVEVRASEHTVSFVRFQDPGYFYRNLTSYMEQNPTTGNIR